MHSVRWRAVENATLRDAHARLGPIICLGPEEVSVNCVRGGIREVYAGGFEKASSARGGYNWYAFFSNYRGVDNMFSMGCNKAHSLRKRMISNIYSKSVVTKSPVLLAQTTTIMYDRFLPYLETAYRKDAGVLNIYTLLSAATMDIVTGYIFGLKASSNLIDKADQLVWFLDLYNSRRSYNFWPQEFPVFSSFVEKWLGYKFTPAFVSEANEEIESWTARMCEGAGLVVAQGVVEPADTPVVYQQLYTALAKEAKNSDVEEVELASLLASEVLDHLAAGFDTSGITLTYAVYELSKHEAIQTRLQSELRTLTPPLVPSSTPALPDPKAIDALPLLHAVIWETLRLHSAIPGPQPRFTPPQGCRLGPEEDLYYVPGGVRVSASAGLLHANEEVYEHAYAWRPERWLELEQLDEEKRKDMESRWFWAFGSGGRMCVGSHLAVYQMKYIVAALYSNYSTSFLDNTGIEQIDSYTAPPKSDKLMIRLEKLPRVSVVD
ncbi:cytochrome P450 [Ampelomyces quisqualis]|uniref:Cytochrome P450 n=1 Tax=Ampelomyces quisqualis TaxID=50730 RepID=A0A6A5Q8P6_AMPQU|nr:cytochrome P450 [Ampelomyces quisqualis]